MGSEEGGRGGEEMKGEEGERRKEKLIEKGQSPNEFSGGKFIRYIFFKVDWLLRRPDVLVRVSVRHEWV